MATAGVPLWSTTAANNATADPAVNFAEGQAPSSVNDSARALMSSVAKWRNDLYGITTSGTSTAFTVATGSTFASATDMSGAVLTIIPHATSGASPTLAVDGLTARAINISTGVAVPTGALKQGTPYLVKYVHASTEFIVLGAVAVLPTDAVPTAAIQANAVTYAKMQDVTATSRIIGRKTSGAGDPEEITASEALDFVGSTRGSVLYRGASGWAALAPGTSGYILQSNGSGDDPSYVVNGAACVLISTQAASSSATIDFTGLDDTYDSYELRISSLKAANDDVEVWIRVGTGGTPTYQTAGYSWQVSSSYQGIGVLNYSSTSDAKIVMVDNQGGRSLGNASGEAYHGRIYFDNPESSDYIEIEHAGRYTAAAGVPVSMTGSGRYSTPGAITAIRIMCESGNIASGRFSLYGYKKA